MVVYRCHRYIVLYSFGSLCKALFLFYTSHLKRMYITSTACSMHILADSSFKKPCKTTLYVYKTVYTVFWCAHIVYVAGSQNCICLALHCVSTVGLTLVEVVIKAVCSLSFFFLKSRLQITSVS